MALSSTPPPRSFVTAPCTCPPHPYRVTSAPRPQDPRTRPRPNEKKKKNSFTIPCLRMVKLAPLGNSNNYNDSPCHESWITRPKAIINGSWHCCKEYKTYFPRKTHRIGSQTHLLTPHPILRQTQCGTIDKKRCKPRPSDCPLHQHLHDMRSSLLAYAKQRFPSPTSSSRSPGCAE